MTLLRYAEAKAANDTNDAATIARYEGNELFETVVLNDHAIAEEIRGRDD